MKELKRNLLRTAGQALLPAILRLLCGTLRVRITNGGAPAALAASGTTFILAFWHGTMLLPWYYHRGRKFLGLTSSSKDGDLLAGLLKRWGYTVARGSSSKGGAHALGMMTDYAKHEGSVAVTPDGPRGPQFVMKPGTVVAAKKSGAPVILLGVAYQHKWVLRKSWDKFEIPKPFSSVQFCYSDPIMVGPALSREDVSVLIERCGNELNRLQRAAGVFS